MDIEKVVNINQIEIVESLAEEIWHEYFTPIIGKAQVVYMLEKFQSKKSIAGQISKGYQYYLIKSDNEFIAYIAVLPKQVELFLSKFYIKSAERNRGLGRKLVTFLEQLAIEEGVDKISLTVNRYNSDAIKAYKKMGFINIGPVVQDIGDGFIMDDYRMEKSV